MYLTKNNATFATSSGFAALLSIDEFISLLIRSSTWTDYIGEDEYKIIDAEQGIEDAYDFLESLGENVRKDDKADKDTWAVGEDGPNVEREIKIEPPMNGNSFRVVMNHEKGHASG